MLNKILTAIVLLFACTAVAEPSLEKQLLGSWCATSSAEFLQEFVLEINENQYEFRTYLHQRPAEFGTWRLEKKRLIISTYIGVSNYQIAQLSRRRLMLTTTEGHIERYKRCD
jgi:hypothetical protein